MKHKITDISFTGNACKGHLSYVADGLEVEVDGEFFIDSSGVVHHQHWFDEEGKDVIEVLFHTKEEGLEYAAYKAGYGDNVVTTTDSHYGHIRCLKNAVIDFENFEKAQKFADMIEGGRVVYLIKKDGHQFWTIRNNAYEPFDLDAEVFGDDYRCYDDADEYWADTWESLREEMWVKPADIIERLEEIRRNYDKIAELEENQQLLIHCGSSHTEVIPKKAMRYYHDTWTHVIGVMQNKY